MGAGGGEGAAAVFQAEGVEQLRGARAGFVARHAVDIAGEQEVLFDGEVVEEAEIFGQDADAALEFERVAGGIEAADVDLAGGGGEQSGEHFDGGGLPGAVGSQEGADVAGVDFEIESVRRR